MISRILEESTVTERYSLTKGSPPGIMKIGNPPSPPFSKGGMAGGGPLVRAFETYFLGNGYEDTVYPL
jgi:hypothetical protein